MICEEVNTILARFYDILFYLLLAREGCLQFTNDTTQLQVSQASHQRADAS